jgi:hypothetical protein
MKKHLFVHGAWFLAAISSFVLGSRLFPAEEESGRNASKSEMRSDGRAGNRHGQSGEALRAGASSGSTPGSLRAGRDAAGMPIVLSDDDIARLGEEFQSASNPIARRLAFSRLLEGLTAENALKIREHVADKHHHSAEFREFHYAWGAVAGTDAVVFGADTKEDDMSPALAGWASADPAAAKAWFASFDPENDSRYDSLVKDRKISGEDLRNHMMGGLVHGLADRDPRAAAEFLQASVDSTGNKRAVGLMHVVAEAVMRTNSPAEAAQWAEALPAGDLRGKAMERVADRYVDVDPTAAASWAENFNDQPEGSGVIAEVGGNWAWRDPEAALSWLQTLPEGAGQSAGMARALGAWARRDPTAAGQHLQGMPASPARDAAISGYSQRVAWEDPQAAMSWAQSISVQDQRHEAMIGVGRAWTRRDAGGAAEWVRSSGLPEEVQAAILNPQRKDRD